ncbi:MAG: GxxExxY protein [Vicinamibacterales bacterium]
MLLHSGLTERIIGAALSVHQELAPGLLESAYSACLAHELHRAAVRFETQVRLPIRYRNIHVDAGYRLDFIVEDAVVLELKAVEQVLPVHRAQLLSSLRLSGLSVGLLLNFNVVHLRHGIQRMVLSPRV